MKRVLLQKIILSFLLGSICARAFAVDPRERDCSTCALEDVSAVCGTTNFYQGLSDDQKRSLDHLINDHQYVNVIAAVRAINTFEKMVTVASDEQEKTKLLSRLSTLVKAVHTCLADVVQTRVVHSGVFVPIFNCCTPRDAYFREVVAQLLWVTGDADINGNLTVGGTLAVAGNETVGGNLAVTGTATVGRLSVLSSANIVGNETIGGTLTVTGSSTLNNALSVFSNNATTAVVINESGGTGVGLSILGNTSQPAVSVAQGAGTNAFQVGLGTVTAPAYSFAGGPSTGLYAPAVSQFALTAAGANKVLYDGLSVLVTSTYRFSAKGGSGQAVFSSTVIVFETPIISSPNYNPATGVYTVPVTGNYLVAYCLTLQATAGAATPSAFIMPTNAGGSYVSIPAGGFGSLTGSAILFFTAGTQVSILTGSGAGGVVVFFNGNTFSMHLISVN